MENSSVRITAGLMIAFASCVLHAVPGLAQPAADKKRVYVGTMVAVPFAQDLHHQVDAQVPLLGEISVSGDLAIGYGIGFAAVAGRSISDRLALELTGSWSKQPSDLGVSLPSILTQQAGGDVELPTSFSYDGNVVVFQSKIDLLVYPKKMTADGGGAKPYLGSGVGIVRSNMDVDIKKDAPTQAFIETLAELGVADLLPEKIDDKGTDFQLALRAGVNVPLSGFDLDLGWQFYRTYVEGEDNSSHVAGGILKYVF